jgi:hypothetical protein
MLDLLAWWNGCRQLRSPKSSRTTRRWNSAGNKSSANWYLPAALNRRLPHLNLEPSEPIDAVTVERAPELVEASGVFAQIVICRGVGGMVAAAGALEMTGGQRVELEGFARSHIALAWGRAPGQSVVVGRRGGTATVGARKSCEPGLRDAARASRPDWLRSRLVAHRHCA